MVFEIHGFCGRESELYRHWAMLANSPLEHPDWLLTWWDSFADTHPTSELSIVTVSDNGTIVALAPMFCFKGRLRLLGSGPVCTDHQQLLVGCTESETLKQYTDWLLSHSGLPTWQYLDLECVDRNSATHSALREVSMEGSGLVHWAEDVPNCQVSLPATWDEYLAMLSKNHRKRCRRWWRKYFDSGLISSQSTADGWCLEEAFQVLIRLHNQRRLAAAETSVFADTQFVDFLRNACRALAPRQMAEISAIVLSGEVIAVELELVGSQTTFAYQSGIATAAMDVSPGSLSVMHRIHQAISRGKNTYDFMRGDEEYKAHWKAVAQPTSKVKVRRANAAGRFAHSSNFLFDFSKGVVRDLVRSPASR